MKKNIIKAMTAMACTGMLLTGYANIPAMNTVAEAASLISEAATEAEFVESYFRTYLIDQTEDLHSAWESCISERTKQSGFFTEQEYTSQFNQLLFQFSFTDVLVNSTQEIIPGCSLVNVSYKYVAGGFEQVASEDFYTILEDGQYKLLLGGVLDKRDLGDTIDDGSVFSLRNFTEYDTVSGISFEYDFVNNSGRSVYMGGWVDTLKVTLITDDGSQYSASFSNMITVDNNSSDHETLCFAGVTGTPVSLRFETITYLNNMHLPDGTTSYTVDLT